MLGLDNPVHILFLLIVLLLVFGAKRLPEMGRSLGHRDARLQGRADGPRRFGAGLRCTTASEAGEADRGQRVTEWAGARGMPRERAQARRIGTPPVLESHPVRAGIGGALAVSPFALAFAPAATRAADLLVFEPACPAGG